MHSHFLCRVEHTQSLGVLGSICVLSCVADTFASCLTHPFPSEGDITCENDSSNLYVNPLDGSGGSGAGVCGAGVCAAGVGAAGPAEFGVRKSASGDGSVLCAKDSQGEGSPRGSRGSLAAGPAPEPVGTRALDASRSSLQPLDEAAAASDDAKPKHRKARFQQVSRFRWPSDNEDNDGVQTYPLRQYWQWGTNFSLLS